MYAVRDLGLTPLEIGVIFGLGNVGAIIGALVAERIARRFGVGPTIVGSALLGGAWPAAAGAGAGGVPGPVPRRRVIPAGLRDRRLQHQPAQLPAGHHADPMLGRMNATMRFIVWGTIPLGSIAGGIIATVVGLQQAILVGAFGAFLAVIPLVVTPVRTIREMPTQAGDPEDPAASAEDAAAS